MNYLIPTILLLSMIGIVIYMAYYEHRKECDCDYMDSTKNVECDKCKKLWI